MRFRPGHVSRPYASMAEWLVRRTLNQLARVRFPEDAYQTFSVSFFVLFFLLEVITGFFVCLFFLFISKSSDISK